VGRFGGEDILREGFCDFEDSGIFTFRNKRMPQDAAGAEPPSLLLLPQPLFKSQVPLQSWRVSA